MNIPENAEIKNTDDKMTTTNNCKIIKNEHYEGNGIDAIDLMAVSGDMEGFVAGNVIKYVARRKRKNSEKDDIVKAFDYMTMLMAMNDISKASLIGIIEKRYSRNI